MNFPLKSGKSLFLFGELKQWFKNPLGRLKKCCSKNFPFPELDGYFTAFRPVKTDYIFFLAGIIEQLPTSVDIKSV